MSDPKRVYLEPECCASPQTGRCWYPDAPGPDCDESRPYTEYVRADEFERLKKQVRVYKVRADLVEGRYLPCPDHRDKIATGEECLMCQRERLQSRVDAAEGNWSREVSGLGEKIERLQAENERLEFLVKRLPEAVLRNAEFMSGLRQARIDGGYREDEADEMVATRDCPVCAGNDASAPCAYPSEGRPGCFRDKRLGTTGDTK